MSHRWATAKWRANSRVLGGVEPDLPASPLHGVLVLGGGMPTGILSSSYGPVQCGEVQRSFERYAVLRVELLSLLKLHSSLAISQSLVFGAGHQIPIQNRQTSSLGVGGGLADAEGIHRTSPRARTTTSALLGSPSMRLIAKPANLDRRRCCRTADGWVLCIWESELGSTKPRAAKFTFRAGGSRTTGTESSVSLFNKSAAVPDSGVSSSYRDSPLTVQDSWMWFTWSNFS